MNATSNLVEPGWSFFRSRNGGLWSPDVELFSSNKYYLRTHFTKTTLDIELS